MFRFDNKWRQMAKSRSGNYDFEDSRQGWLKIGPGKITITDFNNKDVLSLSGQQITGSSNAQVAVSITCDNPRKPYSFAPITKQPAETDMVIRLIQNHVVERPTEWGMGSGEWGWG